MIELKKWSLDEIGPHLLKDLEEIELVSNIKKLSTAFNQRNELLETYFNDEAYVSSYASLYLPTNAIKLDFILSKLSENVRELIKENITTFVDYGCGPGTYSLNWIEHFSDMEVQIFDQSPLMMEQASKIIKGLQNREAKHLNTALKDESLLCLGNVLNEMNDSEIKNKIINSGYKAILLIEPGTKASFQKVLKLRSALISKGYQLFYPCPSQASCPLSRGERKDDWCHQTLRTVHDPTVERLCQLVQLDRKAMPFIGHLYWQEQGQKSYRKEHMLSFLKETKFSFDYEMCVSSSDALSIEKRVLKKRELSKKEIKSLKKGSVG
ncbi:MAG: small ribosomal subunit Rsm22 family protein [Bacteriovoracaceae bacterium]